MPLGRKHLRRNRDAPNSVGMAHQRTTSILGSRGGEVKCPLIRLRAASFGLRVPGYLAHRLPVRSFQLSGKAAPGCADSPINYLVSGGTPSPLIFWNHGFRRRLSLKSLALKNL